MPTGHKIVVRSLRLIGAVGAGQTPSPDDVHDGFETLNDMMDGWGADSLTIPATVRQEVELPNTLGTYTLGPTGTIVVPHPGLQTRMGLLRPASEFEIPIHVMDDREYAAIPDKTAIGQPQGVRISVSGSQVQLTLWPRPNASGYKVALYLPTLIQQFASLHTEYTFLPGYSRAMRYNLAVQLAPEHERPVDPVVFNLAAEYLADIRRNNIRPETIEPDVPSFARGGGSYNIHTDE